MKKLALILPLILFLGCEMPQDKNKKEIEKIKQQITELSDKIDTMNQEFKPQPDLTPKIENLQKQIDSSNAKLEELNEKLAELNQKIKQVKSDNLGYIVIKPTTLITIKETKVYSAPDENSTIVDTFDKKTTFTSYKEQNGFIKVTGYFVHRKWVENTKEWWVKKEDCKVKVLGE